MHKTQRNKNNFGFFEEKVEIKLMIVIKIIQFQKL